MRRPQVHLFTKTCCSLCEPVQEVLLQAQQKIPFDLHLVDIEKDTEGSYPARPQHTTRLQKELRKIRKLEPDHNLVQACDQNADVPWFRIAYHYHIPVVHVDGEEIARHALDEDLLMQKLSEALEVPSTMKE